MAVKLELTVWLINVKLLAISCDIACIDARIVLVAIVIPCEILRDTASIPVWADLLIFDILLLISLPIPEKAFETSFFTLFALLVMSLASPLKSPDALDSMSFTSFLTSLDIELTSDVTPVSNPLIASNPSISMFPKSSILISVISLISHVTPAFISPIASARSMFKLSMLSIPSIDIPSKALVASSVIPVMSANPTSLSCLVDSVPLVAKSSKFSFPDSDTPSIAFSASSAASLVPAPKKPRNLFQALDIKLATLSTMFPSHSNLSPKNTIAAINAPITAITIPTGDVKNTNTAMTALTTATIIINAFTTTAITAIKPANAAKNPAITPIITPITCITVIIHWLASINARTQAATDATTLMIAPINVPSTPISVIIIFIKTIAPGC